MTASPVTVDAVGDWRVGSARSSSPMSEAEHLGEASNLKLMPVEMGSLWKLPGCWIQDATLTAAESPALERASKWRCCHKSLLKMVVYHHGWPKIWTTGRPPNSYCKREPRTYG
ncbi:hypothetical protein MLD38_037271 [Melastoma candidum]|uniref:Uncharacterized protein n=1 Tax=Melastoma candidum TaxID=119954 RepID=A0ACB9LMT1_9MYRT|nr:hypothetical protein MLD38_037271 [Melastoma candidum]